mgnify:CR=1 FL=1
MAIFRKGVKVGNKDIRIGLSKKRGQGILRKLGILEDDKGRKKFEKNAMGDIQTIRTIVGMGEGFTMPVNFRCSFYQMDMGIDQRAYSSGGPRMGAGYSGSNTSGVQDGSLDWRTHVMQNSTREIFKRRYNQANAAAQGMYEAVEGQGKLKRDEQKMNLYCSKVSIPEKNITTALPRQYGAPYAYPQAVQYGTLTTTFYCDGTMHIKNYFDAWQKLIYNDMTGNFNFYNEYTAEFDVHTRTTIAQGGVTADVSKSGDTQQWAQDLSDGIKDVTKKFNDITGVEGPREDKQSAFKIPKVDFRDNYGVRIFECFPSIVGSVDLGHDSASNVATFDVTWAYRKWNPFKMGNLGNRSQVNLAIGEFRNEKDGFPFLEDLPEELSGPLTSAVNQGINTGPLSKASNLVG